jgi:hypothetical protein
MCCRPLESPDWGRRAPCGVRRLIHLCALLLCAASASASDAREPLDYAGHQLPQAEGLWERWDPARSWGTSVLVETLEQVAADVAWRMPEAEPLLIGDVSVRGGGRMPGHFTHQTGNDVDIGVFFHGGRQPHGGFVDVAVDEIDVAATWVLVSALLDTGRVQFILLDEHLIDRLRVYARTELGMDEDAIHEIMPPYDERLSWSERGILRHADNHKSHLHVRVTLPDVERGT